jgi:hypothetical protein
MLPFLFQGGETVYPGLVSLPPFCDTEFHMAFIVHDFRQSLLEIGCISNDWQAKRSSKPAFAKEEMTIFSLIGVPFSGKECSNHGGDPHGRFVIKSAHA